MNHHDDAMGRLVAAITKWKTTKSEEDRQQSLTLLFKTFHSMLIRYCNRLLGNYDHAQDAAAEAILKITRNLDGLTDLRTLRSWVFRITRNHCIDIMRRNDPELMDPNSFTTMKSCDFEHNSALALTLEDALAQLPEEWRLAIWHGDYCDKDAKEAAADTGTSVPSHKSRLYRARQRLRSILSPPSPDEELAISQLPPQGVPKRPPVKDENNTMAQSLNHPFFTLDGAPFKSAAAFASRIKSLYGMRTTPNQTVLKILKGEQLASEGFVQKMHGAIESQLKRLRLPHTEVDITYWLKIALEQPRDCAFFRPGAPFATLNALITALSPSDLSEFNKITLQLTQPRKAGVVPPELRERVHQCIREQQGDTGAAGWILAFDQLYPPEVQVETIGGSRVIADATKPTPAPQIDLVEEQLEPLSDQESTKTDLSEPTQEDDLRTEESEPEVDLDEVESIEEPCAAEVEPSLDSEVLLVTEPAPAEVPEEPALTLPPELIPELTQTGETPTQDLASTILRIGSADLERLALFLKLFPETTPATLQALLADCNIVG